MTRLVDQRLGATLARASRVSANEMKKKKTTAVTDLVSVCNWILWTICLDYDHDWLEAKSQILGKISCFLYRMEGRLS